MGESRRKSAKLAERNGQSRARPAAAPRGVRFREGGSIAAVLILIASSLSGCTCVPRAVARIGRARVLGAAIFPVFQTLMRFVRIGGEKVVFYRGGDLFARIGSV